MKPLPFTPVTPDEFVVLMTEYIWNDRCEPAPDGGIICSVSAWYNDWHDARFVASECGMIRTGSSCIDESNVDVYRFRENPDAGSVRIWNKGSAISPNARRKFAIMNRRAT